MQVTCPNCRARYAVDPLSIGPMGRTVQCARCSEQWFQTMTVAPSAPSAPVIAAPPTDSRVSDDGSSGDQTADKKSGVLSWLKDKTKAKPKVVEAEADRAEVKDPDFKIPESRTEPEIETGPRPAEQAAADVFAPAPDFVIRPGARRAQLPALIEPKADRRMGYILGGAIALLLLMAVGMLLFHNVIAEQLPPEWRTILQFN